MRGSGTTFKLAWLVASATMSSVASGQLTLPAVPPGVTAFEAEGFAFSQIASPNNAAFQSDLRPPTYVVQGRGAVPYEYGIARTEVTTGQWLEFVNTFSTQGGSLTQFGWPIRWGARRDPTYTGPGWRWELDPSRPNAAAAPVWGSTWREAAMLCNWLHNGRPSDPQSLTHGAYDTSTFGYPDNNFFNGFTDQVRRSPGARFWIPSLDEWIKAAFYDPSEDRWWLSHYGSDTPPVYGLPGTPGAQSNAGLEIDPLFEYYYTPLNAYSSQSPYGLLSTSGGPSEWFEDAVGSSVDTGLPTYRLFYQSGVGGMSGDGDLIFRAGRSGELPHGGLGSFRIATSIPGPASAAPLVLAGLFLNSRRRS